MGHFRTLALRQGLFGHTHALRARTLRVGQYLQAGTQLMAAVPLDAVYVVANFKETQRGIIKPCWIVLSLLS
jgi:hypothetical protein